MNKYLSACIFLIVFVAICGCLGDILGPPSPAVYPDLVPDEGKRTTDHVTFTFPFKTGSETVIIPVERSLYYGAKNADKSAYLYEELGDQEWLPGYYRAFIDDTDLIAFYSTVLDSLRVIRTRSSLDDDEYLELITVFVQSIPYETDAHRIEPKFPVETIGDSVGDCDDKSLVLAALLAQEGYDVALLFFEEENHMAVGVGSDAWLYGETGYAFIETTNITLVGTPTSQLDGGAELQSKPFVIPIGSGTRIYTRCDETRYIHTVQNNMKSSADALKLSLESMDADLSFTYSEIEELRLKMDDLLKSGKTGAYNRLVPVYNSKAHAYDEEVHEFNARKDEYNAYVAVYNYIIAHQHDRGGTYEWVRREIGTLSSVPGQ